MKILTFCLFILISLYLPAQERNPNSTPVKGTTPLNTQNLKLKTSNTYAVVVGISDYQNENIPDLRFADRDAQAFAEFLRSPAGGSLDDQHLKVLLNEQATMAQFATALDWLWEVTQEGDQAFIYFSGHGDVEKKSITQPGYLLCWDAPAKVYMAGGAFALPMFQDVVTTLSAQNNANVVVIMDACRSGKLAGSSVGGAQITGSNLARQYANETKILSCQPNEYSVEGEQWGGGRGAFSYHLMDALYGLADRNQDNRITLSEVDRYLEDHVSEEVAPHSQVPLLVGNRTDQLASVFPDLLDRIKEQRNGGVATISPTESRGLAEEVLAQADTATRKLYATFKEAIANQQFFSPENRNADTLYQQLMANSNLLRLHSTLRRNYAAELQDDAQQAINAWLKADPATIECLEKSLDNELVARQLERAAELLDTDHYMYNALKARQYLFESRAYKKNRYPDRDRGSVCIERLKRSAQLEPESPLPWKEMSEVYFNKMEDLDSAFICAKKATDLNPTWILPYVNLGTNLAVKGKPQGKEALDYAGEIDSLHPFYLTGMGVYYSEVTGDQVKAEYYFNKYLEEHVPQWACWYGHYGSFLSRAGKYKEAEEAFQKAIELDDQDPGYWNGLGTIKLNEEKWEEAELCFKKGLQIDSTKEFLLNNLGMAYLNSDRDSLARIYFKKALEIFPNKVHYTNLGLSYKKHAQYEEAIPYYEKAYALDSAFFPSLDNLIICHINLKQYESAKPYASRSIQLDSSHFLGYFNAGEIHEGLKDWEKARYYYHESLMRNPKAKRTQAHLGNALAHLGLFEEASGLLEKTRDLDPDFAGLYIYYAQWHILQDQISESWDYLEEALEKGYEDQENLQSNPDFEEMRKDPGWEELMKKYFSEK